MKIRRSLKPSESSEKSSGKESLASETDVMRDRILDFIGAYIARRGFPPTLRELGKELGRSPQSVMVHLDRLEADGYLTREPKIPRSIRVAAK